MVEYEDWSGPEEGMFSKKCEERGVASNSFQFYCVSHLTFYTYLNTVKAWTSAILHAGSDQRQ